MDEPFAAVDAQTRLTLQEELVRIWEGSRVTVIFVTHSVDEAVFLGDRVIVLTPGPGKVKQTVDIPIPRARRSCDSQAAISRPIRWGLLSCRKWEPAPMCTDVSCGR